MLRRSYRVRLDNQPTMILTVRRSLKGIPSGSCVNDRIIMKTPHTLYCTEEIEAQRAPADVLPFPPERGITIVGFMAVFGAAVVRSSVRPSSSDSPLFCGNANAAANENDPTRKGFPISRTAFWPQKKEGARMRRWRRRRTNALD